MSKRPSESCPSKSRCYSQTLKQAIDPHLPHSLFDSGGVKDSVRWCERYLTLCALLMAWSMADVLADRFDEARRGVVKMFSGRERPGKTHQGFVQALEKKSQVILAAIAEHLRREVRRVAGERHWEHLGFVPIGADGSKVECPKTLANERDFGCAGLGRQLADAVKHSYVRTTSKRARAWAHKKKPKPIGDPIARIADESQIQKARKLRELAAAA